MRGLVAMDDTQTDAPNLPAGAAVCSQESPSSISASGVTPSIISQPVEESPSREGILLRDPVVVPPAGPCGDRDGNRGGTLTGTRGTPHVIHGE